jgi:uncharacterized protein
MRKPLAVVLAILFLPACAAGQTPVPPLPEATVVIRSAAGEHTLRVEVARTEAAQRQGLRGRDVLPEDRGMLFLFDSDRTSGFWMHGVRIPLDIAFIDAGGTILRVMEMEPCRAPLPALCPSYRPGVSYRKTLEVRAGWLGERGIGEGDRVRVRWPDPHREDPASP